MDSSALATTTATTKTVTYSSGWTVNRDADNNSSIEAKTTVFDNTTFSGTNTWDGKIELLSATTATVPPTTSGDTTTTYETPVLVIELGSDQSLSLSKPIRVEFPTQGNKGLFAFFKQGTDAAKVITTICNGDTLAIIDGINGAGQLKAGQECWKDDGSHIYIWTTHLTQFGVAKGTSSSSATSSSSDTSSSSSGGGGRTGVSGGAGASAAGFGGILGSPLAINEISYDKCSDNMAKILISSDADVPPTVRVSTAKSGVVFGTLSDIQPYAELNEFSAVDKYLYEIPISSDESFMMVVVTEEIGNTSNVVQTSVKLLSCEGTTIVVALPEDVLPEVPESSTRFFDTKVKIGNNTSIDASESEFLFINNEELTVSSIVDSQTTVQSVELRSITMGQTDADYIAVKMSLTQLFAESNTYAVSGSIPSFFLVEPGMTYWLHVTDENGAQTESTHYNIGVKPSIVSDITLEVDIPTISASNSIVKPEFYLFNEDEPSYGIVSLVVDGETVSQKSQLIGTGQTQVIFNWNVPSSDSYVSYDIQGIVELFDGKVTTSSSPLVTNPKTITVSGTDMPTLEIIERDGSVLADPALMYASNTDSTVRFTVTDPQGQCIIGGGDECLVNDSTMEQRGGLKSVPYGDQILRIKYSGANNSLERFSITSIDPIIGQWNISLESEDGLIQHADASEDIDVKIKYRFNHDIVTIYSQ
ncbi:MAG: hypothetical protein ACW9XA_04865 [Candidatus Nitrosopumilus sp. bin_6a]